MSYCIVSKTVPIRGINLRARLEAAVAREIDFARRGEIDQAKNRILDGGSAAHLAAVPAKEREKVRLAEGRARVTALAYEAANRTTTRAEIYAPETAPGCAEVEAKALVEARRCEALALQARATAKNTIPVALYEHVGSQFDLQIKEALDETAARASLCKSATVLSFEMSGHVEDIDHPTRGWWNVEVPAPERTGVG